MADAKDHIDDELLDSLVDQPDLGALDAWLEAADEAQLRRAAAWHREHKAALRKYRTGDGRKNQARNWVSTLLLASSAAPGQAVNELPWNDWWFVPDHEREILRRALLRRSREWAAAFVPKASRVSLARRRDPSTSRFLFAMLDTLVRHHDLPVPDGGAFLGGWARAGSEADRYLPVLLGPLLRSSHLRHSPDLPAMIEASIAADEITRATAVSTALHALSALIQPSAQRVLADVLVTLDLTPDELAGRLPLLQSSLATAHGSITAVLLPLAVSLATDAADLAEIAATVAGRAEKRQRDTLLGLLQDKDLLRRLGDDAVLGALDRLAECDDAALRERIVRFRRTLITTEESVDVADETDVDTPVETAALDPTSTHEGMWTPIVRELASAADPLEMPTRLRHTAIRRLLGEMSVEYLAEHGRINRIGHATLLECVVRAAAADPAGIRAWLTANDDATRYGFLPVPGAIESWLRGDLDDGPIYDDRIPGIPPGLLGHRRWRPRQRFVNAAAREALWRAGRVSTVLSTPSHTDGTLELAVLLWRIESGLVPSYTPYDLAQALLRLRLISSDDQARMAGASDLTLPADPTCWAAHASNQDRLNAPPPDGVELIQRWVVEDGVRPLDARWHIAEGSGPYGGLGWNSGDELPLPTGVLQRLLIDTADVTESTSTMTAVTLAPCWTDLAATSLRHLSHNDIHADILIDAPGPMGTPSHAVVLAPLSGPPELQRRAVQGLLELVRRDLLSTSHLCEAVESLNQAGVLPLQRIARGFEQVFVGGGLADLWTVVLRITATACARRPLPKGLPDMLRLLADYLPAVPDRDIPVEITELAAASGTSKSHAEARALMAVHDAL